MKILKKIRIFALIVTATVTLSFLSPLVSLAGLYTAADFQTVRMNNKEAVEKLIELATVYNTKYVNGTVGQKLTDGLIDSTSNNSGGNESRADKNKKRVPYNYYAFDCCGMVKALFLWGWDSGKYQYNGNEDVDQSALWEMCDNQSYSFTSKESIKPGEFLYRSGHCGIYIGDGYAVECTPDWNSGVQISRVIMNGDPSTDKSDRAKKWTGHGELPFIKYTYNNMYKTSSKGMLQLNKSSYSPGEQIRITVKGLGNSSYDNAFISMYSTRFPTETYNSLNNWCYI